MKRIAFELLAAICLTCVGTRGSIAAPAHGTAIPNAAATSSLVEPAYVYRRSVYRGTRYGGCRRVRTCGPDGCVYVRRCW
jgi:hypothetical protein